MERKPTISPRSSALLTPAILASALPAFPKFVVHFLEGRTSRHTDQASVSMLDVEPVSAMTQSCEAPSEDSITASCGGGSDDLGEEECTCPCKLMRWRVVFV